MRKFILASLFLFFCISLHSINIEMGEDFIRLESRSFSYDVGRALFFYKGKYLSYGRLDSLSAYSSILNPYRKYHITGLSVGSSSARGIRGFLFRFSNLAIAFSAQDVLTTALSYDGRFFDLSFVYYRKDEASERPVIYDYRRGGEGNTFFAIVRSGYREYVDAMAILSYSPTLGIDGFYRIRVKFGSLSLTFKYGNTFLSSYDALFEVVGNLSTAMLNFEYSIRYGEASGYTDFFRPYESRYLLTLKLGMLRISHSMFFSFTKNAERERRDVFAFSYDGVSLSLSDGRLFLSINRRDLKMGMGEGGAFFNVRIGEHVEMGIDGGKLTLLLDFSF